MVSNHQRRIIVLGDILAVRKVDLSASRAAFGSHDALVYEDVTDFIGGTAVTAATAFRSYFASVVVVGSVGDDAAGREAIDFLSAQGCDHRIAVRHDVLTGRAMVTRWGGGSRGSRLVVVSKPSANQYLDEGFLESLGPPSPFDIVIVDGYVLLAEPRASTFRRKLLDGWFDDSLVVFDIVPHDASRYWALSDLAPILERVGVIVAEVGTLAGLLTVPLGDLPPSVVDARRTAVAARSIFPDPALLLRFGLGNCDRSLIDLGEGRSFSRATGYGSAIDVTGFGDRVTAFEIATYLL